MFKKVDPKQSFPKLEEEVLKFWDEKKLFEKSLEIRAKNKEFVFYDGPPFATGLPHHGSLLASVIKDVIPRYKTMQGFKVDRRFGWDTHGLPVENLVEKEIGITSKKDIVAYGIGKFNDACRAVVMRYVNDWERYITRVGRWVDFKNNYKTMDLSYMETVLWIFQRLYKKDLIYKSLRTSFYCTHCETPLSNFEIQMDNSYKMMQDPSVTLKFTVTSEKKSAKILADGRTHILAWTTTPWTLPANVALAVKKDIRYVQVQAGDQKYILAKDRLPAYEKNFGEFTVVSEFDGSELVGITYEPLFSEYAEKVKTFCAVAADFVSTEDGTGAVHIAPAFGEDDFQLGRANGLPVVNPVTSNGTYGNDLPKYAGQFYKDANKVISQDLKTANKLFDAKTIDHSVGICWRCKTPLIYMTQEAWFVKVSHVKKDAIKQNEKINWYPEHLKHGRFGKGLKTAPDWNITRNRFWGAPIPIWKCDECHEQLVFGSIEEIEKASGQKVTDLHRPAIDEVTVPCTNCGKKMHRTPEVLDCWFESGSMPYAVPHYPFENKKWFEKHFPGDFIAEYIGQVRGWYYALHIISTALFKKPAFVNSVTTGNIQGHDGFKMSKSRGNYTDPYTIFETFGADAERFYLMASPVMRAENMNFQDSGVEEVVRTIILPIWNSYSFFVTYANIDQWEAPKKYGKKANKLDRWMLSELSTFVEQTTESFEVYDTVAVCSNIQSFLDRLTNWYIRRSRRRFWKSEDDADKLQAYETLHEVLVTLSQVIAPIMPFVSESIYKNLTGEESVHLSDWPRANKKALDPALNKEMNTLRRVVTLGLGARAKAQLKVRQPLSQVTVAATPEETQLIEANKEIILSELNVKNLVVQTAAPDSVVMKLSPNARVLGPKYGGDVQKIIRAAKSGSFTVVDGGFIVKGDADTEWHLSVAEADLVYESKEGQAVEASHGMVVALDTKITPELKQEGLARDIVRVIQDLRREAQLQVDDHIEVVIIVESPEAEAAIHAFEKYIQQETLADRFVPKMEHIAAKKQVVIDGENITVALKKA